MKKWNKPILSVILILLLCLGLPLAFAQKEKDKGKETPAPRKPRYVQPQPQQEEYEGDYDPAEFERFNKIYTEPDASKKVAGLIDYIQNGKSLTLKTYAIGAFSQLYQDYLKAKNWQALADMAEKFLKIPREKIQALDKEAAKANVDRLAAWEKAKADERGDKPAKLAIQGEQIYVLLITAAADAYDKLGNKPKTAEWGEKFFVEKPNEKTAYRLAVTYRDLKNYPKFVEWAKKTLEMSKDPNINTDLSVDLFRYYVGEKKNAEALKYAQLVIKTLPNAKKPEALTDAKWNEYKNGNLADAYFLTGEKLYNNKKYKEAIPALETVLKYDKKRDAALFLIGNCYWHLDNADKAMETFARCHMTKGAMASKCREQLERIYKPHHNNTTIGIEKIYKRIGAE